MTKLSFFQCYFTGPPPEPFRNWPEYIKSCCSGDTPFLHGIEIKARKWGATLDTDLKKANSDPDPVVWQEEGLYLTTPNTFHFYDPEELEDVELFRGREGDQ